jgi:hypothetical protein
LTLSSSSLRSTANSPATRTRCITIKLLPKLEDEEVADHRHADRDEDFIILRRKFLRWATDYLAVLDNAESEMPDGFFSRLAENYHLLFAIADLAGGDWPKKARAAAIKLSRVHDKPSLGEQLPAIFFDLSVSHGTLLTSRQLDPSLAVQPMSISAPRTPWTRPAQRRWRRTGRRRIIIEAPLRLIERGFSEHWFRVELNQSRRAEAGRHHG